MSVAPAWHVQVCNSALPKILAAVGLYLYVGPLLGCRPPCTLFAVAASEHMNTLLNHMR